MRRSPLVFRDSPISLTGQRDVTGAGRNRVAAKKVRPLRRPASFPTAPGVHCAGCESFQLRRSGFGPRSMGAAWRSSGRNLRVLRRLPVTFRGSRTSHIAEVHVQVAVTVEAGLSGIIGEKVDFGLLMATQHQHVLPEVWFSRPVCHCTPMPVEIGWGGYHRWRRCACEYGNGCPVSDETKPAGSRRSSCRPPR